MHLIYDNIVYSLQKYGGISTYWYELSKRAICDDEVCVDFFEGKNDAQNILYSLLDKTKGHHFIKSEYKPLLDRFLRIRLSVSHKPNSIFHSSYFRVPNGSAQIRKVCTVHDFIHDKYHSGPRVFLHNIVKRRCILESDAIITVSNNTRKDLLEYYPKIDPARVITVHNGVSPLFKQLKKEKTSPVNLLFIGSREKYKNFEYAVDLAASVADFYLYIVGPQLTEKEKYLVEKKMGSRYRIFSGLSIETLNELYNNAFCLIYPSAYEGFGIPLLEAMAAGCPFIAFNGSSIPEVAGEAGFLLQELSVQNGLQGIESIKTNYLQYQEKGFKRVQSFSWDKCYKQTLDVYKSLQ